MLLRLIIQNFLQFNLVYLLLKNKWYFLFGLATPIELAQFGVYVCTMNCVDISQSVWYNFGCISELMPCRLLATSFLNMKCLWQWQWHYYAPKYELSSPSTPPLFLSLNLRIINHCNITARFSCFFSYANMCSFCRSRGNMCAQQ